MYSPATYRTSYCPDICVLETVMNTPRYHMSIHGHLLFLVIGVRSIQFNERLLLLGPCCLLIMESRQQCHTCPEFSHANCHSFMLPCRNFFYFPSYCLTELIAYQKLYLFWRLFALVQEILADNWSKYVVHLTVSFLSYSLCIYPHVSNTTQQTALANMMDEYLSRN
jgi:hypothetical protein